MANIALSLLVLLGEVGQLCIRSRYCYCLTNKGPGYRSDPVFDLSKMQPYSLSDLLEPLRDFTEDIALYLPRTSDLRQLGCSAGEDKQVGVVHYCMEGASKVSKSGLV